MSTTVEFRNVKELQKSIKENLKQVASSTKDEVIVMQALLNDVEYKVDIYGPDGKEGEYMPAVDIRDMFSDVISSTTKITKDEAEVLMGKYTFKKSDAVSMVNFSKEYVNTYIDTGRKLPLGGRATSDVAISRKHIEAGVRTYPSKVAEENGKGVYQKGEIFVKSHDSIKVHAGCPEWVK